MHNITEEEEKDTTQCIADLSYTFTYVSINTYDLL